MKSLDDYLNILEPTIEPKRSLVGPVLAHIAANRRRAKRVRLGLWATLDVVLVLLLVSLLRGNALVVLGLGLSHSRQVANDLPLFMRAVAEAVPVVPVLILLLGGGVILMLRRMEHRAATLAPRFVAAVFALGLLGISSGTYAAATATHVPGPAQSEFERSIDAVGQLTVTIDGHVYELSDQASMSLTDRQLKAQAEAVQLNNTTRSLDQSVALDGGNDGCLCITGSMSQTSVTYHYSGDDSQQSTFTLAIDSQTRFFDGAKPAAPFILKPGQLLVVAPRKDGVHASYIARTEYSLDEFSGFSFISGTLPKHNASGRCYNYEEAKCAALARSIDLLGFLEDENTVPPGAEIREVFGIVRTVFKNDITLQDSTGQIWHFTVTPNISQPIPIGGGLRVEFWQLKQDLKSRTVVDGTGKTDNEFGQLTKPQALALIAQGKIPERPNLPIRGLQLVREIRP